MGFLWHALGFVGLGIAPGGIDPVLGYGGVVARAEGHPLRFHWAWV